MVAKVQIIFHKLPILLTYFHFSRFFPYYLQK
nr:MAG TPA: hypothetical protein [Caudoviricetes sp.]